MKPASKIKLKNYKTWVSDSCPEVGQYDYKVHVY